MNWLHLLGLFYIFLHVPAKSLTFRANPWKIYQSILSLDFIFDTLSYQNYQASRRTIILLLTTTAFSSLSHNPFWSSYIKRFPDPRNLPFLLDCLEGKIASYALGLLVPMEYCLRSSPLLEALKKRIREHGVSSYDFCLSKLDFAADYLHLLDIKPEDLKQVLQPYVHQAYRFGTRLATYLTYQANLPEAWELYDELNCDVLHRGSEALVSQFIQPLDLKLSIIGAAFAFKEGWCNYNFNITLSLLSNKDKTLSKLLEWEDDGKAYNDLVKRIEELTDGQDDRKALWKAKLLCLTMHILYGFVDVRKEVVETYEEDYFTNKQNKKIYRIYQLIMGFLKTVDVRRVPQYLLCRIVEWIHSYDIATLIGYARVSIPDTITHLASIRMENIPNPFGGFQQYVERWRELFVANPRLYIPFYEIDLIDLFLWWGEYQNLKSALLFRLGQPLYVRLEKRMCRIETTEKLVLLLGRHLFARSRKLCIPYRKIPSIDRIIARTLASLVLYGHLNDEKAKKRFSFPADLFPKLNTFVVGKQKVPYCFQGAIAILRTVDFYLWLPSFIFLPFFSSTL